MKNDFKVEEGNGCSRDAYLKEQNIQSYFIMPAGKDTEMKAVEDLNVRILFNMFLVSFYFPLYA